MDLLHKQQEQCSRAKHSLSSRAKRQVTTLGSYSQVCVVNAVELACTAEVDVARVQRHTAFRVQ